MKSLNIYGTKKISAMHPTGELGKFLAAQAARLNAEADAAPTCNGYSRRINGSRWVTNPDGTMTHWSVTHEASNDEEAWCQRHDPLRGLNTEGIKAYERLRGSHPGLAVIWHPKKVWPPERPPLTLLQRLLPWKRPKLTDAEKWARKQID